MGVIEGTGGDSEIDSKKAAYRTKLFPIEGGLKSKLHPVILYDNFDQKVNLQVLHMTLFVCRTAIMLLSPASEYFAI